MEEPLPVTPEPHKTQTQTHSIPDSDTTIVSGEGASNKAKGKFNFTKRTKWLSLASFVLVFGAIGSYLLFFSHADTVISNGKIYYSDGGNGNVINPDGSGKTNTTLAPYVSGGGSWPGRDVSLIFSPDGKRIAYMQTNATAKDKSGNLSWGYNNVIVANSDGTAPVTVASQVNTLTHYRAGEFISWSPDGQWLAFMVGTLDSNGTDPGNPPYSIAVVHPDGSGYHTFSIPITNHSGGPSAVPQVAWLSDSSRIVYLSGVQVANANPFLEDEKLCTIKSDGTGNTCVTLPTSANGVLAYTGLTLSPDGTKVLLTGISGLYTYQYTYGNKATATSPIGDLYQANIDGTGFKRLNASPAPKLQTGSTTIYDSTTVNGINDATWSPDGQYIAYTLSPAEGYRPLKVMNSDGTNQKTIDAYGNANSIAWQPIVATTQATDRLLAGQSLKAGQKLTSTIGGYRINMQTDGNLVIYGTSGTAIWNSGTYGKGGVRVALQTDGNFVMYNASNVAVWSAQTSGSGATYAVIQSDGNFVLYKPGGVAVWSSKGGKVATSAANFSIGLNDWTLDSGVTRTASSIGITNSATGTIGTFQSIRYSSAALSAFVSSNRGKTVKLCATATTPQPAGFSPLSLQFNLGFANTADISGTELTFGTTAVQRCGTARITTDSTRFADAYNVVTVSMFGVDYVTTPPHSGTGYLLSPVAITVQ